MGIAALAYAHVGIDVKSLAEFLSLIFLIGLHAAEKRVGTVFGIALAHVVGKRAAIAYEGN